MFSLPRHAYSQPFKRLSASCLGSVSLTLNSNFKRSRCLVPYASLSGVSFTRIMDTLPFTPSKLKGFMFDMDGTLTMPDQIDFTKMRQRLGISEDEDILEVLAAMNDSKQKEAKKIIEEVEAEAREKMQLQPYVEKMLQLIREKLENTKIALVTRNNYNAVDHLLGYLNFEFDDIVTRDDVKRVKPHPECAIRLCEKWGIRPDEALFVGDHSQDMECGKSAGTWTCLVENSSNLHMKNLAHFSVRSLHELSTRLQLHHLIRPSKED